MSAINYVLLSNDICKGVKRVIIDKVGLFDIHSDHFEKVKYNNQNTSDVKLAWSIWKYAISEAVLDVIGEFRKVNIFNVFETKKLIN